MNKEMQIYEKLCEFMNRHQPSCSDAVYQSDSINLACVDFVAELVAIMLEE